MPRVYDKDPYVTLGIPPTATASQIKEAYRRLARKYHPDLNQDPRAADRMKEINWANDILSDPYERSLYDTWRRATFWVNVPPRPNPQPPPSPETSYQAPPPRPTYARPMQTPRAQGCTSGIVVWFVVIMLMNLFRSVGSSPRPVYLVNAATQTAENERLLSVMGTFAALSGGTPVARSPALMTLLPASPTSTVLKDEYGHEDLRPRIVPDTQEWKWIKQYFPELTTEDGLSDEVTFVFWDQIQRALVIETRQSGVYIISTYGGQITAGHYGENSPTATPELVSTPSP